MPSIRIYRDGSNVDEAYHGRRLWRAHLFHLWYLLAHKWFLIIEGRKLGLPWSTLLTHDLSKFRPDEWFGYAHAAYQIARHGRGTMPRGMLLAYQDAQERHFARNPHHWQFWLHDTPPLRAKYMPPAAVREMVADWHAATAAKRVTGMDYRTTREFYEVWRDQIALHPASRVYVETLLTPTE